MATIDNLNDLLTKAFTKIHDNGDAITQLGNRITNISLTVGPTGPTGRRNRSEYPDRSDRHA